MAENTDTETISQEESSGSEESSTENTQTEEVIEENSLENQLKKAQEEALNFKDSWQRERAEFTNYKRRTASELLNSRKEAVKNFIHDLLNPIDNLERVGMVKTEIPELKAFVDGVNMVKKELISVIEKEGIKRLEPLNASFDPMLMEAINSVESEEYKEETVIEVYQPGYYFLDGENQHSIRPARVKVGKPLANG
ncbi:MAG: nucleotide exchange factor GrpE [Leptospira sp.]|nr:nucleotide exchange factor GrpE [Leptospira sp.]NCS95444.1 nucleotide exchange factor GrpE [Leptospira sp.]